MGIKNFCKLLQVFGKPSDQPDFFDSILFDMQGSIYIAIDQLYETESSKIYGEICRSVWLALEKKLNLLFNFQFPQTDPLFTIILSFDGEGVPMKWPTQRERRSTVKESMDKKTFYKHTLLGHNHISLKVKDYVYERLKRYNAFRGQKCCIVVTGSEEWGEGEHKMFQIAQKKNVRHPLIVSVDQDVFMLALMRREHFDTLQVHRYNDFYNLSKLAHLPVDRLVTISILFGNDFIPELVSLSDANVASVHDALQFEQEGDPPAMIATFLQLMSSRLRFDVTEVRGNLLAYFWQTYLWILDYYTRRDFPQLYMENRIYDAFDRNQLLSQLSDEEASRSAYEEALRQYAALETQKEGSRHCVFTNADFLRKLEPYWLSPASESTCSVLVLSKRE